MLIQRRPPCSTTSTFGSALGSARTSPRERVERRSRGFGRFGMAASKRVVDHRRHGALILSVAKDSTRAGRNLNQSGGSVSSRLDIAVRIQRGGGTWPYETPATIDSPEPATRTVPIPSGHQKLGLGDVAKPLKASVTAKAARRPTRGVAMAVEALKCKECGERYPLE